MLLQNCFFATLKPPTFYKKVIETIKSMGVIANSTLDELLIGNTTITSYDELTIKGEV